MAVFAWMRGEMTYMKGSTGVTTNAEQAWNQRQGVCQDLAHLAIGVPAQLRDPGALCVRLPSPPLDGGSR